MTGQPGVPAYRREARLRLNADVRSRKMMGERKRKAASRKGAENAKGEDVDGQASPTFASWRENKKRIEPGVGR